MNASASRMNGNGRILNSLIQPLNSAANAAAKNLGFNISPNSANSSGGMVSTAIFIGFLLLIVAAIVTVFYYFGSDVSQGWDSFVKTVKGYFGSSDASPSPAPPSTEAPTQQPMPEQESEGSLAKAASTMEKVLPGGSEVFNVASNRFTYYDAQPLCKAFGAELATYEQVKDAWKKGADWCNYGWVKGQMAVYPTSDETFAKLQGGPEEQRMSCGNPGLNGGYFDNPELRFGVNCYGKRPAEKQLDASELSKNAPISPDALAFDKKVNKYKSEIDTIPVSPFNSR